MAKKIKIYYHENTGDKMNCLFNVLDSEEKKYKIKGHGNKRRVIVRVNAEDRWNVLDKGIGILWWE